MAKDVLFYNEIGRQGKSCLAYNFYSFLIKQGVEPKYVTNDMANISFSAKKLLKENLIEISAGDEISIDSDDLNIFDFGGFLDSRIIDVVQYVQKIVVPISYSSNSELTLTAQVIKALSKHNPNIVVVFNKTKNSKVKRGQQMLNQLFTALEVDVLETFTVNESEYMTRLADFNQSIYDVAAENKGDATRLQKSIIPQLEALYTYISE